MQATENVKVLLKSFLDEFLRRLLTAGFEAKDSRALKQATYTVASASPGPAL